MGGGVEVMGGVGGGGCVARFFGAAFLADFFGAAFLAAFFFGATFLAVAFLAGFFFVATYISPCVRFSEIRSDTSLTESAQSTNHIPHFPGTMTRKAFRMASDSKLFTSIAIMQLRDAGKLRLDDRSSRFS